jgi:hypothetical protein
MQQTWANAINYVLSYPAHYDLSYSKFDLPHPLQAGFVPRIGEQKGQIADYGMTVADGRGVHVLEFQGCYLIHWDEVDPITNPIGHIVRDAPHYVPLLWVLGLGLTLFVLSVLTGE